MLVMISAEMNTKGRWRGVARLFCVVATVMLVIGCGTSHVIASNTNVFTRTNAAPNGHLRQVYRVPSLAMEPTLPIGTRVFIEKRQLAIGAIVVFNPPEGFEEKKCGSKFDVHRVAGAACGEPTPVRSKVRLIRRIVAGPSDEIFIRGNRVYRRPYGARDFIGEKDFHVRVCANGGGCNFPIPIKIPAGHWFLMGDNRGESDDSRFWGPVPTAWIIGTASGYRRPKF